MARINFLESLVDSVKNLPASAKAELVAVMNLVEVKGTDLLGPRFHAFPDNIYMFLGDIVQVTFVKEPEGTILVVDVREASAPPSPYRFILPKEPKVIIVPDDYWAKLIKHIAEQPEVLYTLTPRKFEELVAELFTRDGMRAELTPPSKDGGRDIHVRTESAAGEHLIYVECKHYKKENPVGVEIVRGLYGVVEADKVTAGLLVTTSYFTKGAVKFKDDVKHRLSLKDFNELLKWIKKDS